MISLNYQNILKKNIGLRNGLSHRSFHRACDRYQPLVDEIFKKKNQSGYSFLGLPDDQDLVRKIKAFATAQKKMKWENIVVLGIGGSALGLIAIQEALLDPFYNLTGKPRLFVVDNIDPDYTAALLDTIDLKKTLFIVISKSGTTIEPMMLYGIAKERLMEALPKTYQKHFVFVTDPKNGLLRKMAKKEGITAFDVPQKTGGRFSVLSAVGLLPVALTGVDIGKLMKGAREMCRQIQKTSGHENIACLLATMQYQLHRKKGKSMTVMMPYANALFRFSDWYRQLLAESIGKNKKTGITPINALGTTDQHSQLQLYLEGPNDKFILFLTVKKPKKDLESKDVLPAELGFLNHKKLSTVMEASQWGTMASLAKNGRVSATLEIAKLNEEALGELFLLFEFQVALLGLMYNVNAFDQPGVEEGKRITKAILEKK